MGWEWVVNDEGLGRYEDPETGQVTGWLRGDGENWWPVEGGDNVGATIWDGYKWIDQDTRQEVPPDPEAGIIPPVGTTPPATGDGQTYSTRTGPLTADQLKARLSAAGYGGPWDTDSMVAAYNRAGSGSGVPRGTPNPSYSPPSGGGSSGGGSSPGSFSMAGGLGQLQYELELMNQELLRQRLRELDIPGLNLQRRSQIFSEINALRNQRGYIDPEREARMIPGYTTPQDQGGYGYQSPQPYVMPKAQPAPAPAPVHTPPAQDGPPPDSSGEWRRAGDRWQNVRTGEFRVGKFVTPWVAPPGRPPTPAPSPDETPPGRAPEFSGDAYRAMFAPAAAPQAPVDDVWAQMRQAWGR